MQVHPCTNENIQLPINNVIFKAIDLRNGIFEDKILAIFDTNINKLKNGEVGLFLYNKELYIAKYYSTKNNTILIFLDKNQTTLVFKNNNQPENLGKLFTFIQFFSYKNIIIFLLK